MVDGGDTHSVSQTFAARPGLRHYPESTDLRVASSDSRRICPGAVLRPAFTDVQWSHLTLFLGSAAFRPSVQADIPNVREVMFAVLKNVRTSHLLDRELLDARVEAESTSDPSIGCAEPSDGEELPTLIQIG